MPEKMSAEELAQIAEAYSEFHESGVTRRLLAHIAALEETLDIRTRALNEIAYYDRGHPAAGMIARQALTQEGDRK